jgi:hypothetical protein
MTRSELCRRSRWPLATTQSVRAALVTAALSGVVLLFGGRAAMAAAGASLKIASTDAQEAGQPNDAASPMAKAEDAKAPKEKSSSEAASRQGNPVIKTGTFHLGIQITTLPEVVRSHLQLQQGVLIERVQPNSPAAKAGLQPQDILLAAGQTPIHQPEDVLKVLRQADGKPLALHILRQGQRQTVQVTPEPAPEARPEGWPLAPMTPFPPGGFGGPMPPDFKQWPEYKQLEEALERFRSKVGRDGVGLWFARPGLIVPPGKFDFFWGTSQQAPTKLQRQLRAEFTDGLTVEIVREEPQPAKIHVQRGEQSWEVTEDRLYELPKDLVPRVQRLLGMGLGWPLPIAIRTMKSDKAEKSGNAAKSEDSSKEEDGKKVGGVEKGSPPADAGDRGGLTAGEVQKLLERLERANQVAQERMEEAIRQLRKELEELRKGQAAPAKP